MTNRVSLDGVTDSDAGECYRAKLGAGDDSFRRVADMIEKPHAGHSAPTSGPSRTSS